MFSSRTLWQELLLLRGLKPITPKPLPRRGHKTCRDKIYMYSDLTASQIAVLSVACGGESASFAGGNCNFSNVTAVSISCYFLFWLISGIIPVGRFQHDLILLNKRLRSHFKHNSGSCVTDAAAEGQTLVAVADMRVVFLGEGPGTGPGQGVW